MSVDKTTLEAKSREGAGKGPSRRLRQEGLIPAVVYGRHLEKPVQIAVDPLGIRKAINTPHKFNTLIQLKVAGGAEQLVLLKDYQQDPVSREILHADFIGVKESEKIKVKVPLALVGKAVGTLEGGILSQSRREVEVWALPTSIPEKIEADVSHLKIASAMHINEVKFPAGVELKTTVNYTIAVVSVPEKEEVVAVVAAAAVPGAPAAAGAEAGKAAPGADGKAAPAAAAGKDAPKKDDKKK
jgi:large subunit ribosomal protein L25